MLIRSQDKSTVINIDNVFFINITDINGGVELTAGSSENRCIISEYSTREKAMKVLDMLQEAYGDSEYTKYVIPEVCKSLSMKSRTEENMAHAGEIGEMLKKGMTFQMPADEEVEA